MPPVTTSANTPDLMLLSMVVFSIVYITLHRAGTLRTLKSGLLLLLSTTLAAGPTLADMQTGHYLGIAGSPGNPAPYFFSADQHEPYRRPFQTVEQMLIIEPAPRRRLLVSEDTLRHMAQKDAQSDVLAMSDDKLLEDAPVNAPPVMAAARPEGAPNVQPPLFGFDKSDVTEEAQGQLQPLIEYLRATPDARVILTGHTDSTGPARYNQLLSLRRADAVQEFLLLNGIDRKMIRIMGAGEKRPVKSNARASGRRANRRVTIVID